MRIVVFGAGGRVGSRTVAEALARGHEVTAVVRDPEAHDLQRRRPDRRGRRRHRSRRAWPRSPPATTSPSAPSGTGFGKAPETLPAAARALLEGLSRAGVARLIVLGGAGSLEVAPGVRVLDTARLPRGVEARRAGPGRVAGHLPLGHDRRRLDLRRARRRVLEPGERTGEYRTGDDRLLVDDEGNSAISMEDFAVALLDEAESADHVRRRFTVAS